MIEGVSGQGVFLCKVEDLNRKRLSEVKTIADNFDFWFSHLALKRLLLLAAWRLSKKSLGLMRRLMGNSNQDL